VNTLLKVFSSTSFIGWPQSPD